MMQRMAAVLTVGPLVFVAVGCVPGYNSMIFTTKTNAGLVVDTKPPEASVDIGRFEGLIAPTYEAGKTPPVMASFRWDSDRGFLRNYLGSTFTTGDAAVAMSRLYDDPDPTGIRKANESSGECRGIEQRFDSSVPLSGSPQLPRFVPKEKPRAVRPVLFTTDTSFGFKVSWQDPAIAPMPDYFRLAYQRRELAFAPVAVGTKSRDDCKANPPNVGSPPTSRNNQSNYEAAVPSLLATVDAKVDVSPSVSALAETGATNSDRESRNKAKKQLTYLQYFASGSAATALAMRKGVRDAMLKRLDPEQDIRPEIISPPTASKPYRQCIDNWVGVDDSGSTPLGLTVSAKKKRRADWVEGKGDYEGNFIKWYYSAEPAQLCEFITAQSIRNCPGVNCP